MDTLNNEFLLFLSCAQKNGLRYLLIGGYAVNYYGYNRNTEDMDIWVAPDNQNRQSFINTLLCMNYFEIQPGIFLNIVPYEVLKQMKLRAHREKDMFDIARLEEIINAKKSS